MNDMAMEDPVGDGKLVELTYQVIDIKTNSVLTSVDFPIGYVHGVNEILAPQVTAELEGKLPGDVIEVPIDCRKLFGDRDESLVVTDRIENVPEEFRKVGTSVLMENEKGDSKTFLVTRVDDTSVTIDGNNPLCGREVIFKLDIVTVRDATEEEIELGGPVAAEPDISEIVGEGQTIKPISCVSFQWRHQNTSRDLLALIDPESPVYGALRKAIARFEETVFELTLDKPTLIEWANSQDTLQDTADRRELRLGSAHVFQQSIELLQGLQMMTDRDEDPQKLSAVHHSIGDVMGFIGQRSGSVHFLEQAALSYEQALELRTEDKTPVTWAQTTFNMALVMHTIGQLEDDASMLKQALAAYKQAVNLIPRKDDGEGVGTVLYQLGTHRRGSRTLEQALVAFRNSLSERTLDKGMVGWAITQNNMAATLQALGEHEEDIGSLEASIPVYDSVLKELDREALPLIWSMVSANRVSAMQSLATESDYLDMAETAVSEFEKIRDLFDGTDYTSYHTQAVERLQQSQRLVASLQV